MFGMKVKTDNAAFEGDNVWPELARILRNVADRLERGEDTGPVFDINGNKVGGFEVVPD